MQNTILFDGISYEQWEKIIQNPDFLLKLAYRWKEDRDARVTLEDENAALKAKQSIGSFDQDDADSLKELVGNSVIIGKDIPHLTGIDTRSITEMDLSAIDEGWD